VPISLSSVHSRIKSLRPERIIGEAESLRKQYQVKIPPELFNKAVAIHLVLKDICAEQRLDAVAIDCWNETVPKFEVSPCLGFAENHYRIACEGDAVLALTLGLGEAICGQPGYCGDLYSIDEQKGLILLVHCGACADLHSSSEYPRIVSKKLPGPINQKGTVITCHTTLPKGPATMVLLHGSDLNQLHIQRCEIISTEFSDQMKVTVLIKGDVSDFLQKAAGNHYIVFPGDNVKSWKIWAYWSGVSI
jgi:L-fucose isomerase-like protein